MGKVNKDFVFVLYSKRRGSNDLTVIKLDNGNSLTDESVISECMNNFFTSVVARENLESIPAFGQVITDVSLSSLHCSTDEVAKLLKELNPRKSLTLMASIH